MKIFSYVITHNEANRYLEEVLISLQKQVDGVCVYDDRSTDGTVDILKKLKIQHMISSGPSFSESEAEFREDAWRYMERLFEPRPGDWILTLDADEFLRTAEPLKDLCRRAQREHQDALWMHVNELWEPDKIRIDQYWGTIRALRLAEWKPNGKFSRRKLGGGSLPDYVKNPGGTNRADIVHYGYVRPKDRQAKYDRYADTTGHSAKHIKSILQPPMLAQLPPML